MTSVSGALQESCTLQFTSRALSMYYHRCAPAHLPARACLAVASGSTCCSLCYGMASHAEACQHRHWHQPQASLHASAVCLLRTVLVHVLARGNVLHSHASTHPSISHKPQASLHTTPCQHTEL